MECYTKKSQLDQGKNSLGNDPINGLIQKPGPPLNDQTFLGIHGFRAPSFDFC